MTRFLFSNSSTKDWHTCKRKFWWRYLAYGRGLTGAYVEEDLLFGSVIHTGMEHLWRGEVDQIPHLRRELEERLLADPLWFPELTATEISRPEKAAEWGRLLEGQLYAAHRLIIPYFRRGYELQWVEADAVRWVSQQVGLIAKPDTLLTGDGIQGHPGLGYLEWKTVSSPDQSWHRQWVRNPQSWTGAITLDAAMGQRPEWFTVVGLVKGVERNQKRSSPLCWGYWRNEAIPVKGDTPDLQAELRDSRFDRWRWEYTSRKGWFRRSTDEFPGGVKAWVDSLPDDVLSQLFVITPPIDIEWDLAEEWLANHQPLVEAVEQELRGPSDLTRFPRELSQCEDGPYGKPCVFRELCHNPAVAADPLGSGKYIVRRPHHQLEQAMIEQEQRDGD